MNIRCSKSLVSELKILQTELVEVLKDSNEDSNDEKDQDEDLDKLVSCARPC